MFAIFENNGKQYKANKDELIKIDRTDLEKDAFVTFDNVLLLNDGKESHIGAPNVAGATVTATVVGNERDKKIIVFKKKRRHNYRRKIGHKQEYTLVKISDIKLN